MKQGSEIETASLTSYGSVLADSSGDNVSGAGHAIECRTIAYLIDALHCTGYTFTLQDTHCTKEKSHGNCGFRQCGR